MTEPLEHEYLNRRDAFLADLVEVCKKHRVMLRPDGSEWHDLEVSDVCFEEHSSDDQYSFWLALDDVENAVRLAVWPIVHTQ
jgi:hypothetical protein